MTTEEFSNEFDTLSNSYFDITDFNKIESGLEFDEYEKSVYLTKAQEEVILSIYKGEVPDITGTEEQKQYLKPLIETIYKRHSTDLSEESFGWITAFDNNMWFILHEEVIYSDDSAGCRNNKSVKVVPISYDEYETLKRNPFRGINANRALRLLYQDEVKILSKYKILQYTVTGIRKPSPIILINLPDDLTIDNENKVSECELHEALHRTILERAVKMAISSRISNIK